MKVTLFKIGATLLSGVLLAGCTSYAPTATPESTYTPSSPSATASPQAKTAPVSINLKTQSGSGQSGKATFEDVGGGYVKVTLALVGKAYADPQPAHIHTGTCEKPGPVKYPLTNVVNGASETTVTVAMADLWKGDLILNVHKSAKESTVYTACGELKTSGTAATTAPAMTY